MNNWRDIKFDNFESQIPEDILVVGEALFDAHAYRILENCGNFISLTQGLNQVRINYSKTKLKTIDCTCKDFIKGSFCKHIGLSLFIIRKEMMINDKSNLIERKKQKASLQLKTKEVIDIVSENELKIFVANYCKTNRTFEKILKARFLHNLYLTQDLQNINYYQIYLEEIFPPLANLQLTTITTRINDLISVVSDLMEQIDDFSITGELQLVVDIVSASLKRLFYASYLKKSNNRVDKLIEDVMQKLTSNIKNIRTPQLREKVIETVCDIFELSYYPLDHPATIPLINIAIEYGFEEDVIKVKEILKTKMSKSNPSANHSALKLYFGDLDIQFELTLAIKTLTNINGDHNQTLFNLLERERGLSSLGFLLLKSIKFEMIERNKFISWIDRHSTEEIFKCFCYLDGSEAQIYYKRDFTNILNERANYEVLAKYFCKLEDWERLLDCLEQMKSLEVLMKFDHHFIKTDYDRLLNLYKQSSITHFNTVFGNTAIEAISDVLRHLLVISADKLRRDYIAFLEENYGDRPSLKFAFKKKHNSLYL